jgi:hypothetical protein
MIPPVEGETTEGFKKLVGAGVLSAGAIISMVAVNRFTGVDINPLNYVVPANLYSNR